MLRSCHVGLKLEMEKLVICHLDEFTTSGNLRGLCSYRFDSVNVKQHSEYAERRIKQVHLIPFIRDFI